MGVLYADNYKWESSESMCWFTDVNGEDSTQNTVKTRE